MARKRRSRSSRRRRSKARCSPYKKCKTGPTLKDIKEIARNMGIKGYSKYTSRNIGSLKRKIVAAGGVVPPTTYREPYKHRITSKMRYNLDRFQNSGRQKGAFYNLVGAPCSWLPKDALIEAARRLGVDVKQYKKTKQNLCRVLTKAIREGSIPEQFDASGLLDHFRQMHPQDLGSAALRAAVAAPRHADRLAQAQAAWEQEREQLSARLLAQGQRIAEMRQLLGRNNIAIPPIP